MTMLWKRCPICNGRGKLSIMQTRIKIFDKKQKKKNPLIDDTLVKCPNCKGKGEVFIKSESLFKPWNPFRKNN